MYEGDFLGRPAIFKQRFSKKYRHATLDAKLTQARLKQVPQLASRFAKDAMQAVWIGASCAV